MCRPRPSHKFVAVSGQNSLPLSPGHVCLLQVPTASASPLRHSFGSTVPRKALCRVQGDIRSVKFLASGTRSRLPCVFTRRRVAGFDLGGNLGECCSISV